MTPLVILEGPIVGLLIGAGIIGIVQRDNYSWVPIGLGLVLLGIFIYLHKKERRVR